MTSQLRILIADDHGAVREGLQAVLSAQPDFEVVGAARDGVEAIAVAGELRPDVILMDLVMPRLDGLQATRQIRDANPEVRILLLTSFADDGRIYQAIKEGALGYLLKDTPREQLCRAIRDVAQGRALLHPTIAFKIMQEIRRPPDRPLTKDPLTLREVETLHLVTQGLGKKDVAVALGVDVRTVAKYVSSILCKLRLASRTRTSLYALGESGHPQSAP